VVSARKTPGRIATASRGSKKKNLKRQFVNAAPAPSPGFLIVGIGASAGGLEAMEEFFHHMSPSNGMAFVVVSHQHAGHVSLLPSLLSRCTAMSVVEATDGMEVEANRVYLAPGGTNLAILRGTLHLMEPASQERVPLPIDYFLRSLAEDRKQGAIGIILSGTGTDGTLGLRAIRPVRHDNRADPRSAKYRGMYAAPLPPGGGCSPPANQMSEPLLPTRGTSRAAVSSEHDALQTLRKSSFSCAIGPETILRLIKTRFTGALNAMNIRRSRT
jgi:chemotaxis response regulator CheB